MSVAFAAWEFMSLPSVRRSLIGLFVAGVSMPVVGVLIVGLDIITVRFAVMHTALLGAAVGIWVGIDSTVAALVACVIAALAVAPAADRPNGISAPMSYLMTISAAAALLVLSVSGVNANGAFEVLWGSILAMRVVDLCLICVVALAVLVFAFSQMKPLSLLLFDRETAKCSGVAVTGLTTVALVLVALSVGTSIRVTGALLVDSVTILPALAARNLADSTRSMFLWAIGIGMTGNLIGFFAALQLDLPPGPVLVVVAGLISACTTLATRRSPAHSLH